MSTQPERRSPAQDSNTTSEEAVVEYLHKNPDFFEQHSELLAGLKLPHQIGGAAVSLVERQVAILRQRNTKVERKLRELVSVARVNESLSAKIHALCMQLMDVRNLDQVFAQLEVALRQDFGADQAALIMFDANTSPRTDAGYVRRVGNDEPALKAFKTFLSGGRPRCGQMRDVQRTFLFGEDNLHIGSAALVPLGDASSIGMLAIGNKNATHFHPAMSTDFLGRLGEVVGAAIARYSLDNAA